jgi:hypothetical protein
VLRRAAVGVAGGGTAVRSFPRYPRLAIDLRPVRWWMLAAFITLSAIALALAGAEVTRAVGWTASSSGGQGTALLGTGALGSGWVRVPDAVSTDNSGCFQPHSSLFATGPAGTAAASWAAGPASLPMATETVAAYPSPAAAQVAYQTVVKALSGCTGFATPVAASGSIGAPVRAVVTPWRLTSAVGYLVTVRVNGVVGAADFVLAQRGSHVMLLVYSDAEVPAPGRVSALTAAALARIGRYDKE